MLESCSLQRRPLKAVVESLEPLVLMSASSYDAFCQGTEGNDVLLALSPGQVVDGLGGHDLVIGVAGDNELRGGAGNDSLFALRGPYDVDGGDGRDILYFWGIKRADVDIVQTADGRIRITTAKSTAYVSNVETFQFKDARLSVDELFRRRNTGRLMARATTCWTRISAVRTNG